jgi:hypothetical protein
MFWIVLIADIKNNFKKIKKIISMYFDMKSYLKSNHNYTAKYTLRLTST